MLFIARFLIILKNAIYNFAAIISILAFLEKFAIKTIKSFAIKILAKAEIEIPLT